MGGVQFVRVPAAFAFLFLGLTAAAFTRSTILRLFCAVAFGAGMLLIHGYRFAVGEPTRYFNFVTTIDARSAFADAFAMHDMALIAATFLALLGFIAIAIKPPPVRRLRPWLRAATGPGKRFRSRAQSRGQMATSS